MVRLLLPFTHGIDSSAITYAIALAQHLKATLTLLSLIHQPQAASKGPRWEDIQQSRDFLEYAQHKAVRSGVLVERMELYTHHAPRSIRALAQEMDCTGIVLVVRRGSGLLLATNEIKQLLEERSVPIYVVSLPTRKRLFSLPSWLSRGLASHNSPNSVLRWEIFSDQAEYQSHDLHVLTDS